MTKNLAKTFIYLSGFLFAAHLALTSYVNSTVIGEHLDKSLVGLVYAASSLGTICMLWLMPLILRKFGAKKVILTLAIFSMFSLFGLSSSFGFVIPVFFLYLSLNTLVVFSLDILLEHYSDDESTGGTRGAYLSLTNMAWVFAPLVSAFLIENFGYTAPYKIGLIFVVLVSTALMFGLRKFKDDEYPKIKFVENFSTLKQNKNIRYIMFSNFFLHFFYSWMVIYTPIYLHEKIGFAWSEIGIIFMIMLLPFVFVEYPLGKLADKIMGEKELLILGFVIMSVSTFAFSMLGNAPLFSYAIVLFLTRVGASIVEIMSETYFFKQINGTNTGVLGMYRSLIPLGFILGPILGGVIILFFPVPALFAILSGVLLFGIASSSLITDTK